MWLACYSPWRETKTGIPGRNLEAKTESETVEGCLLACFLWLVHLPFLHSLGPLSKNGTTHSWLGPPLTSNQENVP